MEDVDIEDFACNGYNKGTDKKRERERTISEFRLGLAFLRRQHPQVLLEDLARSRLRDRVEDKDAAAEALVVCELLLDVLCDVLLERRRLGVIRVGDNCASEYGGECSWHLIMEREGATPTDCRLAEVRSLAPRTKRR